MACLFAIFRLAEKFPAATLRLLLPKFGLAAVGYDLGVYCHFTPTFVSARERL